MTNENYCDERLSPAPFAAQSRAATIDNCLFTPVPVSAYGQTMTPKDEPPGCIYGIIGVDGMQRGRQFDGEVAGR